MKLGIFTGGVVLAQALGILCVLTIGVWMGHYQNGFAWQTDPEKQFNYHPLFMVIGMIFLFGDAILVYRIFRNERKIVVKVIHASLQILALIFAAVGLKAVFDNHNLSKPAKPNMWSLHSWMGITTVVLFCCQWLVGFLSFLFPKFSQAFRERYKTVHVYWGMTIFVMAIATALMGITENIIFHVKDFSTKPPQTILANLAGLMMVGLGILVVFLVSTPEFAREPTPDEEHVQLTE